MPESSHLPEAPVSHADIRAVVELMREWLPETADLIERYVANNERVEAIALVEIERLAAK